MCENHVVEYAAVAVIAEQPGQCIEIGRQVGTADLHAAWGSRGPRCEQQIGQTAVLTVARQARRAGGGGRYDPEITCGSAPEDSS